MVQLEEEHALDFRVPSQYSRCRRPRCDQPPVADMHRTRAGWEKGRRGTWWAYCAAHLAEYRRVVRDGKVWWVKDDEPREDADAR